MSVILPMLVLVLPALAQKDLPEGQAKEYVSQIWLQCHSAAQLLSQKRTEADWRKRIARMATNFPKEEDATRLNMNRATPGEFRQWGDMLVIYGVDGLKVEAAKDKMTFQLSAAAHGQAAD